MGFWESVCLNRDDIKFKNFFYVFFMIMIFKREMKDKFLIKLSWVEIEYFVFFLDIYNVY